MAKTNKSIAVFFIFTAIIALALFLRLFNLGITPPGVFVDEAYNGLDAYQAATTNNYQWFYSANNGREGLFINFIAILFKLFGASVITLRLPAVIAGALTIVGIYLLTKELLQKRRPALIAAFLFSASFWAIDFNRISFRANLLPLVLVFSFYLLFKGLRQNKKILLALSGAMFGLGLHTYIAFRIAPLIIIILALPLIFTKKYPIKQLSKYFAIFLVSALITALPLIIIFINHPELWSERTSSLSLFAQATSPIRFISIFIINSVKSLFQFNIWGDQNWRHNYPPLPILDFITCILFLGGVIISLKTCINSLKKFSQTKKLPEEAIVSTFLISWLLIMLLPEILTVGEVPHALRSIGTMPAVFIFAAMFFDWFLTRMESLSNKTTVITAIAILILSLIGISNITRYYIWSNKSETAQAFNKITFDAADYIKETQRTDKKVIIGDDKSIIPLKFLLREQQSITYWDTTNISTPPQIANGDLIIFVNTDKSIVSAFRPAAEGLKLLDEKTTSYGQYQVFKMTN